MDPMPVDQLLETYKTMRGDLFSGFLGVGAFLLSMKAYVMVIVKEKVYDQVAYQDTPQNGKVPTPEEAYAPLCRFGSFLHWAIVFSLLSALLHFSLGLVGRDWAAITCLAASAIAMLLLGVALVMSKRNLDAIYKQGKRTLAARREAEKEATRLKPDPPPARIAHLGEEPPSPIKPAS